MTSSASEISHSLLCFFVSLLNNKDELYNILDGGAQKAQAIAEPVLKDVYKIVGFR